MRCEAGRATRCTQVRMRDLAAVPEVLVRSPERNPFSKNGTTLPVSVYPRHFSSLFYFFFARKGCDQQVLVLCGKGLNSAVTQGIMNTWIIKREKGMRWVAAKRRMDRDRCVRQRWRCDSGRIGTDELKPRPHLSSTFSTLIRVQETDLIRKLVCLPSQLGEVGSGF